jgi:glycosyltransferase involved in cell wall biosynthesis
MKQKVNIVHIISSLENKGPVQVIYDLLKNSDFNKYNFTLIALKPCIENSLKKEFDKLPIKIIQLTNISIFNFFKFNKIVHNIINSDNITIAHSHCTRSLIINSFTCKGLLRLHSIQIYPGLQSITMNGFIFGHLINYITKKLLRNIEFPVSCSNYVHDELLKKDNITSKVIVNGSASKLKFDYSFSKSEIQLKLGLDPSSNYLISVGRLSPEKNYSSLIRYFIKSNLKNFKLIIVGDGPLEKELKNIANNDVLLLGFKSNFEEYIYASDYYVSTSLTEGMPLSVIVAMEMGIPLFLSNIPAHAEIFNTSNVEGKEIGRLMNIKNDIIDFNEIINAIDKNTCIQNVKSVYINNYSPKKMASFYNDLYAITLKK